MGASSSPSIAAAKFSDSFLDGIDDGWAEVDAAFRSTPASEGLLFSITREFPRSFVARELSEVRKSEGI